MLLPFLVTVTDNLELQKVTLREVRFNGKAEVGEFVPPFRLETRINSTNLRAFFYLACF